MPLTGETTHSCSLFNGSTHSLVGRTAEAALFYDKILLFPARSAAVQIWEKYPSSADYLREEGILQMPPSETYCYIHRVSLFAYSGSLFMVPLFDLPVRHERENDLEEKTSVHITRASGAELTYSGFLEAVIDVLCDRKKTTHLLRQILRSVGLSLPRSSFIHFQRCKEASYLRLRSNLDLIAFAQKVSEKDIYRPNWLVSTRKCGDSQAVQTRGLSIVALPDEEQIFQYDTSLDASGFTTLNGLPLSELLLELVYAAQRLVILAEFSSDAYEDDMVGTPLLDVGRAFPITRDILSTVNFALPQLGALVEAEEISDHELHRLLKRSKRFRGWFREAKHKRKPELLMEIQAGMNSDPSLKSIKRKMGRWACFTGAGLTIDVAIGSPLVGTGIATAVSAYDALVHDRLRSGWSPSVFLRDDYRPTVMRRPPQKT